MPRAGASTFHDSQSAVRGASAKPHSCVFSSTNRNGLDVYVTRRISRWLPPPLFPLHLPSPSVSPPLFSFKQDARAPSAEKTSTHTGQRKCSYSRSLVCACEKEAGGGQRVSKVPCSRSAKRNLASPPCGAPPRPGSAAASGLPCRAPLSVLRALGRACPAPGLRLFTTQEALPPSRIRACFRANRNGLDVYVTRRISRWLPPPLFPLHLPSPSVSPPLFSVKQDARAPSAKRRRHTPVNVSAPTLARESALASSPLAGRPDQPPPGTPERQDWGEKIKSTQRLSHAVLPPQCITTP
jgi:hypothetical protein